MLVVLSGLPGVGKTTLARELAAASDAVHVRIDSIEQALRNAGWKVEGEGYDLHWDMMFDCDSNVVDVNSFLIHHCSSRRRASSIREDFSQRSCHWN